MLARTRSRPCLARSNRECDGSELCCCEGDATRNMESEQSNASKVGILFYKNVRISWKKVTGSPIIATWPVFVILLFLPSSLPDDGKMFVKHATSTLLKGERRGE